MIRLLLFVLMTIGYETSPVKKPVPGVGHFMAFLAGVGFMAEKRGRG